MSKRAPDHRHISDDDEESEVKRPVTLTDEQRRFVNHGFLRWSKIRQQWTGVNFDSDKRRHATTSSSSPHSSSSSSPSPHSSSHQHHRPLPPHSSDHPQQSSPHSPQLTPSHSSSSPHPPRQRSLSSSPVPASPLTRSDSSDEDDVDHSSLDLQDIMQCLKTYRAFQQPIKLRTIVDIIQVLWEDEVT